jgi:ABC-type multidrug transport system permease subunit
LNEDDSTKPPLSFSQRWQWWPRWQQTWACTWRNMKRFQNNIPGLIFLFLLPSLQIILFCIAIGRNPSNLPFGVVNYDTNAPANSTTSKLLSSFESSDSFSMHYYSNEDDAFYATRKNNVWGYMVIPYHYSENTANVSTYIDNCVSVQDKTNCTLKYRLDESDQQIAVFIESGISDIISTYTNAVIPNATQNSPIQHEAPVYGSPNESFTDFIAPGIIITIAFSQSIGLTALGFVMDAKLGTLDRGWSSGLRPSEVMLAHVVAMVIILTFQIVLLLVFGIAIFKLPMEGSIVLVFLIAFLLGMAGAMYGLVIAALCQEERQAMQISLGSFFPVLLLSGVIWPLEAIPVPLNYLSLALPTTWAATSGRDIMSRGWGLNEQEVWLGFVIVIAWCLFLFFAAAKGLRSKN